MTSYDDEKGTIVIMPEDQQSYFEQLLASFHRNFKGGLSRDLMDEIDGAEALRGKTVAELGNCRLLASTSFTIQEETELRKARRGVEKLPIGLFKSKFEYAELESVWYYKPKTMELSEDSARAILRYSKVAWRKPISFDKLEQLFPGCLLVDARRLKMGNLGGLFVYPSYDEEVGCPVLCYVGLNRNEDKLPRRSMLFLEKETFRAARKFSIKIYDERPGGLYTSLTTYNFAPTAVDHQRWRESFVSFGAWADRILALVCDGTLVPLRMPRLAGRDHYRLVTAEEARQLQLDGDGKDEAAEPLRVSNRLGGTPAVNVFTANSQTVQEPEVSESSQADLEALRAAHEALLIEAEEYRADAEKQFAKFTRLLQEAEFRASSLAKANNALERRAALIDVLEFPSTPAESLRLAQRAYPDRLFVHANAEKSAAEFDKGDPMETWDILRSMATVLYQLVFSEESVNVEAEFKAETNLGIALGEGPATTKNNELARLRRIEYQGRLVDISAHVKGRTRRAGGRLSVHYYADHDNRLIVVGHCGSHLPTAAYASRV